MIDALLERAATRFVFVVGKGGVGKTTTAGAIALAFADRSHRTHLISTDPAHSLGDLFLNETCNESLTIEEFNARAYADRLFENLRQPLSELIERGSYLDAKDAASFLDLSIPGIDEVMSAFRLVELLDSKVEHIVVDTAPTGHAIRLLDAGKVIESWISAGHALSAKAGAVASALMGRPIPLQADALLDEWKEAMARYRREVLQHSSAVVVTRAGAVVEAETTRLIEELSARGVRAAATVAVGDSAASDFAVARIEPASGCAGLRQWREHLSTRATAIPRNKQTQSTGKKAAPWLERLKPRYIWVAGKGGVGKSTCACALATLHAESRNTCVVSTDPAGSLADVFGVEVGREAMPITTRLYARQIDALSEFERMRSQYREGVNQVFASLGLTEAAHLDRRVLEALWDFAPPGIDEIVSLIEIVEQAGDFETLIIDSAPTGHFLRLIQLPELALDWVHSLMRLIIKYGAAGSLDALARDLLAFAKRLRQLHTDLSTPGTSAVFVVTLDEPMVHAETARLSSSLKQAGVPVAATILNRGARGKLAGGPWIMTPDLPDEVVGPAALRQFIAQWTLHGE